MACVASSAFLLEIADPMHSRFECPNKIAPQRIPEACNAACAALPHNDQKWPGKARVAQRAATMRQRAAARSHMPAMKSDTRGRRAVSHACDLVGALPDGLVHPILKINRLSLPPAELLRCGLALLLKLPNEVFLCHQHLATLANNLPLLRRLLVPTALKGGALGLIGILRIERMLKQLVDLVHMLGSTVGTSPEQNSTRSLSRHHTNPHPL